MNSSMNIEEYDYLLANDRIAKYPVEPRDRSNLLVYKNGKLKDAKFTELADFLPESAFLVFNNTRVIPARLFFRKETGALIEIFLLHPVSHDGIISQSMESTHAVVWECMIGNKKKWKNESLYLEIKLDAFQVKVTAELTNLEKNHVKFSWDNAEISFAEVVKAFGQIPLPPYLNRPSEEKDLESYQTVYAFHEGAVAAPTAGLHFTDTSFKKLAAKGISTDYITLHVGAGTFQPVKVTNAVEHEMHSEQIVFSQKFIENLIANAGTVIPVGTTSMRSLESLYWFGVKIKKDQNFNFQIPKLYPYQWNEDELPSLEDSLRAILKHMTEAGIESLVGETEIFILPGYTFRTCGGIVTNFHQPKSTLLLLISALIGDKWKTVYNHALSNKYRFLSYGDSSLLIP